jgi:hypothetical protein
VRVVVHLAPAWQGGSPIITDVVTILVDATAISKVVEW